MINKYNINNIVYYSILLYYYLLLLLIFIIPLLFILYLFIILESGNITLFLYFDCIVYYTPRSKCTGIT